ncbi:autotransporter outer membrane beta-barrel domain-containing protein [Megasphaera massiliensis]|uniref:autotransporter outer membrane beta-barrel domain-containing protein n=1 Tax=Megasphaera massiliensis TaxID=1232428 RepID=UPI000402EC75|nr:autotransporter outer membrane beta-barrel domain-containing protein [Megasphaera massiliensis]MBS6254996.1 autotransporter outer membrane beta-barrel domain-containing protein [Megasphaera sp.]
MSGKKRKSELLRVLVLSALLSTTYLGAAAADYPLTGDTIEGKHELPALENLYKLDGEQKVTALSDVTVVSKSTDEGKSAVIISSTTSANSSLDLDMNGHSLAIDAKTSGIYITKDNTNVNIHNANSIEGTINDHDFVVDIKGNGSSVNFQANNIIFNKTEVYPDTPMFAMGNKNTLSFNAGNDIVFNNYARANTLVSYSDAKIQLEAGHNITFNHTYSDTAAVQGLPILYFGNNAEATITAGNDINFNRNQYAYLIGMQYNGKAVVTAAGNINFREQTPGYLPVMAIEHGANIELQAQAITGNTQQIVSTTYGSQALLKANEINWVAEGRDMSDYAEKYPYKTSMLVAYRNGSKVELQADKAINLSIGVPHTMLYAESGNIALNAGDSIYLHSTGATDERSQANLRVQNGNINLTAGKITVENEGATAAYADYYGNINFNGSTVINGAGTGASAESDLDPWAEDLSKITFDGDVIIDAAETGASAKYNSDVVFNKGLAIDAKDNAFYTESAGRIQALATGVDKVIKGNMQALNGQIDVLLDTADSSFTGKTELQNIEKVFSWDDEEEYDDEDVDVDIDEADDEDSEDGGDWEVPFIDETPHINIALKNGAVWNVTGDSSLTNLENDAFVNLSDANRTGTGLTAQTLSGTGTMVMDLDWTSNGGAKEKTVNSDYLTVTESATGTQDLVSDKASMHLDAMGVNDRLYFATLANSDAVFTSPITQRNVQKGHLYDYIIGIDSETTTDTTAADTMADRAATDTTTDWFFGTVGYTESPLVETGRINSNIMYDLVTDVDTLNKRMGDVRQMNTDPDGWWARTTYAHQGRDFYSGHSNRFELGKDFVMTRDDGSTVHQGAVFTYLRSSDSFDNGNGKYKRYSGSLYHTWLGNNGQYVDVVGRIGKVMGNSHTFLVNGTQSDSSFGTWYQQASVETGKTYDLEDGWYFEPQAQLQYTHMNSKSYTSSDGINHDLDSVNSFIGRLGFRLEQKMNDKASWYVKGDILHEFSGDGGMQFTSVDGLERINYSRDGKDTWYDLGAGLTAELSPASSLWFEFERKFSSTYSNDWEFNGGISWKF